MSPSRPRSSHPGRVPGLAAAVVLAAGVLLVPASPAAAELVDPPGSCVGTGAWQDAGFSVDSSVANPADIIEIPRADAVSWTGQVNGPQEGDPRPIAGSISLKLPPPLGFVTFRSWEGTGITVTSAGTETYDLSEQVPAGVVFQLRGEHQEGGAVFCSGSAQLRIAGGPFDTIWVWIALAGTVLMGLLLLLTGRGSGFHFGRAILGALLGLLFGVFVGSTVLLFGLVSLASPVLTIIMLLGLILGAAWASWAPLGGRAEIPPDMSPVPPDTTSGPDGTGTADSGPDGTGRADGSGESEPAGSTS
jgi:hypothetical protein